MNPKISEKQGGFLIERPDLLHFPWILGVQGTPLQMGYQQGILLSDLIRKTASGFLTPIFAQFGGWQPGSGESPTMKQIHSGREALLSVMQSYFIPALEDQAPDLLDEMKGIAAGLGEAGVEIPEEDILIGNCVPEITELQFYLPGNADNAVENKGCSDCVAWGRATENGGLIHGTNYDYATFNVLHKGIGMVVARPDSGYPFMAQCLAGTVGFYRGINLKRITTGELTSESSDRNIKDHPRIPHAMHMRKMLQFASSTASAVDMMKKLGGTTGYNHMISDAKMPGALVIEASCNKMAVVNPNADIDAL